MCERQKEERPEREAGGDRDRGDVKKEEGGRSRRRGERDDDDDGDDGDDGEDPAGGEEDVKVEGEGGEAEALLAKVRAAEEEAEGSELKSALEELLEAA